jgi:CubicO group peptidase (beta-lactamase class C family)
MTLLCVLATLLLSSAGHMDAAILTPAPCPLLGPDVLTPTSLSSSSIFKAATTGLEKSLDTALQKTTAVGKLDSQTTSFSLDFYSIHDPTSLFTYHHSAPGLANPKQGVSAVGSNTIYRIGSVSKLWTAYFNLIEAGDASFNEPITKYVPELAAYAAENKAELQEGAIGIVDWDDITVGALASHITGVPRDGAPGPAQDQAIAHFTGLPLAPAPESFVCGDIVQIPCDRSGVFFFPSLFCRTSMLTSCSILR